MSQAPQSTDSVEFKGKKTQRSRGHERRDAILQAALRIIAREGVRAVRHRAVAREAQVPLAATTYYFKDIKELIYDAFALFAAEGDKLKAKLEERSFAALAALSAAQQRDARQREAFIDQLSDFIEEHIAVQLDHVEGRMVENAFHLRALYDPELGAMLAGNRQAMREKVSRFFVLLGSSDPLADTECFLALILHLEYECLAARQRGDEEPDVRRIMRNCIDKLTPAADH
ncbi:MAG: TetR family transcriptional regulator [Wenzhouxiangellaceae bacterium]